MNRLPTAKRAQILSMLCEGTSMRAVSRLAEVSLNTVSKLLVDAGTVCAAFHDEMVRDLTDCTRVQADEIWSFCGAKVRAIKQDPTILERNPDAGDAWTFTAIDADSKLIVSWLVGNRSAENAYAIMDDIKSRVSNRIQLTTDQLTIYMKAVDHTFQGEVDYAMLHKLYRGADGGGRYSPAVCIGCEKRIFTGEPDPKHISTSYVERANLTMRMHMRRFTRLTNGFSKKLANHCHMVAVYSFWYNWVRTHKTLNKQTPAMAAKLADRTWTFDEIIELMDQIALVPATHAN